MESGKVSLSSPSRETGAARGGPGWRLAVAWETGHQVVLEDWPGGQVRPSSAGGGGGEVKGGGTGCLTSTLSILGEPIRVEHFPKAGPSKVVSGGASTHHTQAPLCAWVLGCPVGITGWLGGIPSLGPKDPATHI